MSKFYLAALAGLLILGGCKKDDENYESSRGKMGEWSVYITDSTAIPVGPWDLILYQDGDSISGQLCSENLIGTMINDSIQFRVGDVMDEHAVIYHGFYHNNSFTGYYSFVNGGGGAWEASSGYLHYNNNTYYVWGGMVPDTFPDELGTHPERYGFHLLGYAHLTHTFYGDFPYYIILTYPSNTANVDAVGCDGGVFFETSFSGHAYNKANIGTGPDGKYATLGKAALAGESGPGGFVGIDASLPVHSSLMVYIDE